MKSSALSITIKDEVQKQLISDITKELVFQNAPQELPLYRAISESFFKDPEKTLKGKTGKDEMLGFGVGAAVMFLTPIALAVTADVVIYIAEEVVKNMIEEVSSNRASDLVRKMFKKFRPAGNEGKEIPTLSSEQLAQVHSRAFEKASQLNLPEAQARLLADSLVGSLVV